MSRTWAPSSRYAALGIAAALAVAAAPAASAQLPGVDNNTQVFPLDDDRISIVVDPVNLDAGTVRVFIQNNSTSNLTCTGLEGGPAATVTTAEVVAQAIDFYTEFPYVELSDIDISFPSALGSIADAPEIGVGSIQGLIPGSAQGFINPAWAAANATQAALTEARLAGQYSPLGTSLSFPAGTAQEVNATLQNPSAGTRADFQSGVILTCVLAGQRFVFHAFEGDQRPNVGTTGSTGSLGSAGLGS
ncbi:hypothetical protein [Dietzia cercidiphylli]|uniref:hypothetical protein n=1 Tax=Dietzia cercidiphylli TaxID=498199 RepID=UPI0015CCE837|nr:hypothetical protein [Dietzia cercidiphylli]MCT1517241.1 hypothetical protein [Dietzia cercidiphylli]